MTTEPFFLSKFELTASQWRRIRGEDPPPDHGTLPVVWVNWVDCSQALSGMGLSLPTSAQWEYASSRPVQSHFVNAFSSAPVGPEEQARPLC